MLAFSKREGAGITLGSRISVAQAAMFLLVPGAVIRYGLVLPNTFGTEAVLVSGSIRKLSVLVDLGFTLLAYLAVTRGRYWTVVFWALFIPHYFTVFLEFKKSALVLSALLPIIGAYIGSGNIRGLVRNLLLLAAIYLGSQPVVHHARAEMNVMTGDIFGASFSQRVDLATDLVFNNTSSAINVVAEEETQSAWLRLSYAANQAIAMRAYDNGNSANTITQIWQTFIPRALWPEKPTFTYLGRDFYYLITGLDGRTLAGATVFADSYWNYGWWGVVLIGLLVGLFFGFASNLALRVVKQRNFIYLPVIMLSMDMAMRQINGFVLTGFFGQLPFYFAFLALVWSFSKVVAKISKKGTERSLQAFLVQR